MICSHCSKEITDGARFCRYCGGSQPAAQPAPAQKQVCPGCGRENQAGARFCIGCGQPAAQPISVSAAVFDRVPFLSTTPVVSGFGWRGILKLVMIVLSIIVTVLDIISSLGTLLVIERISRLGVGLSSANVAGTITGCVLRWLLWSASSVICLLSMVGAVDDSPVKTYRRKKPLISWMIVLVIVYAVCSVSAIGQNAEAMLQFSDYDFDKAYLLALLSACPWFYFLSVTLLLYFMEGRSIAACKALWRGTNSQLEAETADLANPSDRVFEAGHRFLLVITPFCLIPNESIAWVYQKESKLFGLVLERDIIIKTTSKKTITLVSGQYHHLVALMQANPHLYRSDIIFGLGPEQKARYKALVQ